MISVLLCSCNRSAICVLRRETALYDLFTCYVVRLFHCATIFIQFLLDSGLPTGYSTISPSHD